MACCERADAPRAHSCPSPSLSLPTLFRWQRRFRIRVFDGWEVGRAQSLVSGTILETAMRISVQAAARGAGARTSKDKVDAAVEGGSRTALAAWRCPWPPSIPDHG
jgi:hypothetical protein